MSSSTRDAEVRVVGVVGPRESNTEVSSVTPVDTVDGKPIGYYIKYILSNFLVELGKIVN